MIVPKVTVQIPCIVMRDNTNSNNIDTMRDSGKSDNTDTMHFNTIL